MPGLPFSTRLTVATLTLACLATSASFPGIAQAYVKSLQRFARSEPTVAKRRDDGLEPGPHVQLGQQVADVVPDGLLRDLERLRDLRRRAAVREQLQHLLLPRREPRLALPSPRVPSLARGGNDGDHADDLVVVADRDGCNISDAVLLDEPKEVSAHAGLEPDGRSRVQPADVSELVDDPHRKRKLAESVQQRLRKLAKNLGEVIAVPGRGHGRACCPARRKRRGGGAEPLPPGRMRRGTRGRESEPLQQRSDPFDQQAALS